jgi:hypothetical protein
MPALTVSSGKRHWPPGLVAARKTAVDGRPYKFSAKFLHFDTAPEGRLLAGGSLVHEAMILFFLRFSAAIEAQARAGMSLATSP